MFIPHSSASASKSLNTMPVPWPVGRVEEASYRVGEAAGLAHDRHGAVTQAVHLIEPARLVQRGHHEDVARPFDPDAPADRCTRARNARGPDSPPAASGRTCSYFASPLPTTTNPNSRHLQQLGQRVEQQIEPFCEAMRLTMPNSGVASLLSAGSERPSPGFQRLLAAPCALDRSDARADDRAADPTRHSRHR